MDLENAVLLMKLTPPQPPAIKSPNFIGEIIMTKIVTKANTVIPKVVRVNAFWDAEAGVWCASSSNMHGVITEASTIPELKEMLADVIEFILEEEESSPDTVRVLLTVKQPRTDVVVPELAAAAKEITAVFRNSKSNSTGTATNDIAPLGLIVKESFSVAMAR